MTTARLKKALLVALSTNSLISNARGDSFTRSKNTPSVYEGYLLNLNTAGQGFTGFVPAFPVTFTKMTLFTVTNANNCVTAPILALYDSTTNSALVSITLSTTVPAYTVSGLNLTVPANDVLGFVVTSAAASCSSAPAGISFAAMYR